MSKTFKIRKGLDIRLKGLCEKSLDDANIPALYAIKPIDFSGIVPKLKLKEGEKVKAGETVFFDKSNPEVCFVSPVSGVISKIVRGDKRKLLEIIIEADGQNNAVQFNLSNYKLDDADSLKTVLLESGIWPFIKQRPYGVIANSKDSPRDIFVSMFDSAPLAADVAFLLKDKKEELNIALKALKTMTEGNVYLSFGKNTALEELIENKDEYKINYFHGPHPAGLTGVQIDRIRPINKADVVWTVNALDLVIIGSFLLKGVYNPERIVALAGSEIENPQYFKTLIGADHTDYLKNKLKSDNVRVISGNVLTGSNISKSRFLGFYDSMITVIPEGDKHEMFGWALPGLHKLSMSSTFLSKLLPRKKFAPDTNIHGGVRAFVLTGQYEKVCPIDIYPQLLIKAILAEDIDKMEQMGIYEIIEEDLALCEFACTSKIDIQEIIRDGLDLIRKEME